MSDEVKLLPCPFCGDHGGIETFATPHTDAPNYSIFCDVCHASSAAAPTREQAIEAWNTRPAPVADAEELMCEFYLSRDYNPNAARPADNVKAAIAFTLTRAIEATRPPIGTDEVVGVENVCPVCRGDAAKCACEVSDLQRTFT